uniref:Putative trypsin inhibitor like cysteine rich domain protein n=1 Tax=Amblyomma triste TaxID=251400 RepID=A0A023G3U0_AMBTT
MRFLALVVFAFVLVAAVTAQRGRPHHGGGESSGPNEEFSTCKRQLVRGSHVPPSCRGTRLCTADCRQGCFCKNGFFRNARRLCVRRKQCP